MADDSQGKKRENPNSGGGGGATKKFYLPSQAQDGHIGVLVSADRGREPRSAKEMIDLFDEVADLYFPLPAAAAEPSEEDAAPVTLEAELAKELSEMKKNKKKRSKRFQVIETGCKNMVFIKFLDLTDPNAFVIKVFDYLANEIKKPRTRYSNRVLPIEKSTFVSQESIVNSITPGIQRVFRDENESKRPFKFCVELRARNNDKLNKDDLKRVLVQAVGKGHFVDLKTPNKILLVEIFAKAAGVAVIDAEIMAKYKGFNIRSVSDTFGEPLPPHPDEKEPKEPRQPKTGRPARTPEQDSAAPSESAAMNVTETAAEEESNQEDQEQETTAPQSAHDDSDSDSDNGGISIF